MDGKGGGIPQSQVSRIYTAAAYRFAVSRRYFVQCLHYGDPWIRFHDERDLDRTPPPPAVSPLLSRARGDEAIIKCAPANLAAASAIGGYRPLPGCRAPPPPPLVSRQRVCARLVGVVYTCTAQSSSRVRRLDRGFLPRDAMLALAR